MRKYTLFTDGASRGNPGASGIGAIAFDEHNASLFEYSCFLGEKTNNYAEYMAVLAGLKKLKKKLKTLSNISVEIRLDSELIARQLKGEYQIKEQSLQPLFIAIHNFCIKEKISPQYTHIPREKNERADTLANKGIDDGIPCEGI